MIVRLGYRAYGESGVLVLDDMFDQNVQGALSAGLEVGVYFFSQATTLSETVEEADFVLEHIRQYDITAPVVFDTEEIKGDEAEPIPIHGKISQITVRYFATVSKHRGMMQ